MNIFTYGNFDILHVEHFNLLLYCKSLAGINGKVTVAIDSDDKIKKEKRDLNRPIFSQEERRRQLYTLKDNFVDCGSQVFVVNHVNIFNTNEELYSLVKSFKPDFIVKGSKDYGKRIIGEDLCEVKYCNTNPMYSTSNIIRKIVKSYNGYDPQR